MVDNKAAPPFVVQVQFLQTLFPSGSADRLPPDGVRGSSNVAQFRSHTLLFWETLMIMSNETQTPSKRFEMQPGGTVSWWLGHTTDPEALRTGLDRLGFDYKAEPRTWNAALKVAMAELSDRGSLVRSLANRDEDGYTAIKETKGHAENDFDVTFNAKVNEDGEVTLTRFESVAGKINRWDFQNDLQVKTAYWKRVLPAATVSSIMEDIVVKRFDGQNLREKGGMYGNYFFPEEHEASVWKLREVIINASASNRVTINGFTANISTFINLKERVIEDIKRETQVIKDEITKNEYGDRALTNRVARCDALIDRMKRYEGILGETLGVCRECIDSALVALSVQTVTADDTFDDVYA